MSFYLLPPVSYQTQQKLKNQVERKKQSKHKHRHDSKSSTRTHRQQSIDSSASSIRSPPKLVRSPSIFTKNTGERSIDELSNLDSLSIRSDNSNQSNQTTKTTKTTKSSKSDKERKAKNHTYNYTHTTDINEIIKYGRSHRSKYASSHVTPSNYSAVSQYEPSNYTASQYSPSECSSSLYSDLADDRHPPQAGVNPNFKLDFNKVPPENQILNQLWILLVVKVTLIIPIVIKTHLNIVMKSKMKRMIQINLLEFTPMLIPFSVPNQKFPNQN